METDWNQAEERIQRYLARMEFHPRVVSFVNSRDPRSRYVAACSGGADSVFLLLSLLAWPRLRNHLVVAHFNHRLRGEESDADERFVRRMAEALRLPFESGYWERAEGTPATETTARKARIGFLHEVAGKEGANAIFFAHQRDDIAETMIMRLARGAGTGGLAAPRPVCFYKQAVHLRPLLRLDKRDILAALKRTGVAWREDSSNSESTYLRNRIRNDLLPVWQGISKHQPTHGAAHAREMLEEDDEALEVWLAELLPPPEKGEPLPLSPLLDRPVALWRRAVSAWLAVNGIRARIRPKNMHRIIHALRSGHRLTLSLSRGRRLVVAGHTLSLWSPPKKPEWDPAGLPVGNILILPSGSELAADWLTLDQAMRERILSGNVNPNREAYVNLPKEPGVTLSVRRRRAGDRFTPLGAPGSRAVKRLMIDKKIPADRRHLLPVLCSQDNTILWIPGLPPADERRIDDQTDTALKLTYKDF